jgi:DNA end-binding protein Ku
MALVDAKVKAGDTNRVEALEAAPESSTNVVDLTELLKRSLKSPANAARPGPAARKTAPQRTSATRKQATKEAAKRA